MQSDKYRWTDSHNTFIIIIIIIYLNDFIAIYLLY